VIYLKLNIIKRVNKKREKVDKVPAVTSAPTVDTTKILNIDNLKNLLGNSEDIKFRDILINNNKDFLVNLILIDGLVNAADVSNYVVKPLMQEKKIQDAQNIDEIIKLIEDGALYFASQSMTTDLYKAKDEIMNGSSILVFSQKGLAFIFDTKGFDKRSMMEPTVENVSKGPKDSFIENYRTNTATIRRKIRSEELIIESSIIGTRTFTTVGLVFIKSIASDAMVEEARSRLKAINADGVISSSSVEDALSADIHTVFPQVVSTERPDKFCADILEGRVGVIVGGLPFGFIVPGTFVQFIQNPEDYAHSAIVSSFIRCIRFLALIISIILPSLYIAITTFHPEMIPTNLALFLAKSREGVALPIAVETIVLLLAFEILYEAGLRVPKTIRPGSVNSWYIGCRSGSSRGKIVISCSSSSSSNDFNCIIHNAKSGF